MLVRDTAVLLAHRGVHDVGLLTSMGPRYIVALCLSLRPSPSLCNQVPAVKFSDMVVVISTACHGDPHGRLSTQKLQ